MRSARLGIGAAGLAALGFFAFAPAQLWWQCPIHAATGIYCPGCGGQRWLHAVLQGRFEEAWHYNQLFWFSPLFLFAVWALFRFRAPNWVKVASLGLFFALTIAFVIWRNQPPQVGYLAVNN